MEIILTQTTKLTDNEGPVYKIEVSEMFIDSLQEKLKKFGIKFIKKKRK